MGLNFMDRGQIGVIIMFSIVLDIKGPFRFRLLQQDPMGVEMSSPSPFKTPIFTFAFCSFSRQRLRIMMGSFMLRWIYSWQTDSITVSQLILQFSFITFCEAIVPLAKDLMTLSATSLAQNLRQLQSPGPHPLAIPIIGGASLQLQYLMTFIRVSLSPTTTIISINLKFFQLASMRITPTNS